MEPLRIYSTDLSFYDNYIEKLIEETRAGFLPAIERLSSCAPRFADISKNDFPGAELTTEDAHYVYRTRAH